MDGLGHQQQSRRDTAARVSSRTTAQMVGARDAGAHMVAITT